MKTLKSIFTYSFEDHIASLRDGEKATTVLKYEEHIEPLTDGMDVTGTAFYKKLRSMFDISSLLDDFSLTVPEYLESDYDYPLLLLLVLGSLSSRWELEPCKDGRSFRLKICVNAGGSKCEKYLDELVFYQIERLFEIYVEEQMNLSFSAKEDGCEDVLLKEMKANADLFKASSECLRSKLDNQRRRNFIMKSIL